jgi:hypothetical protein
VHLLQQSEKRVSESKVYNYAPKGNERKEEGAKKEKIGK